MFNRVKCNHFNNNKNNNKRHFKYAILRRLNHSIYKKLLFKYKKINKINEKSIELNEM